MTQKKNHPKRLVIGISGASGVCLGVTALSLLKEKEVETHLVISRAGARTLQEESDYKMSEVQSMADYTYPVQDIGAAIASGSFKHDGMLILPCSIKTMSEIATGITGSLLSRAADVTLKEKRRLLLMVREAPLHSGHLKNLYDLSLMGAVIMPPVPAYYTRENDLASVNRQIIMRALSFFDVSFEEMHVWQG